MSRPIVFAVAAALALPLTLSSFDARAAIDVDSQCQIKSRYDLEVDPGRIVMISKDGGEAAKLRIEMRRGALSVNDEPVPLTVADRERVEQFQRSVEAIVPKVRAIARESIDIAFEALTQVAVHFSSPASQERLLNELTLLREEALQTVEKARSSDLEDSLLESRIEAAVARMVPVIVGEITTQAISAAMSGDSSVVEDLESRGEQLEKQIEASVEASSKALEAQVARLCPEVEALDQIDNAFEWQLPNGQRPDLLDYAPPKPKSAQK